MSDPNPSTADAYKRAYEELYAKMPKDVRDLIDAAKNNTAFQPREVQQFVKDVIAKAQYEPTEEELAEIAKKSAAPKIKKNSNK